MKKAHESESDPHEKRRVFLSDSGGRVAEGREMVNSLSYGHAIAAALFTPCMSKLPYSYRAIGLRQSCDQRLSGGAFSDSLITMGLCIGVSSRDSSHS